MGTIEWYAVCSDRRFSGNCVLHVARYFCYSVIPCRAEDMSSITSEYNFSTRLSLSDSYHVTHNSMWYSLFFFSPPAPPTPFKGLSLLPTFAFYSVPPLSFIVLSYSCYFHISTSFLPFSAAVSPKRLQSCSVPSYLPCVSLPIPQGIKEMASSCR